MSHYARTKKNGAGFVELQYSYEQTVCLYLTNDTFFFLIIVVQYP